MNKKGVVKVEPETHRRLKVASALTGRSISEIVEESVAGWMERNQAELAVEARKIG